MTNSLYLHEAYLKEMDATILDVTKESDNRWLITLDKTVFYPRGGGQSNDQGTLSTKDWTGQVYQVLQKEDKVVHYVESSQPPSIGTQVKGVLDWNRRYLNMRLHSAGHVVDFALYLLGYSPEPLTPLKCDHGKKAFITYQGLIDFDIQPILEKKANELILQNLPFSIRFVHSDQLEKETIYLQPNLPKNKPLRLLTLQGVGGVADGGTQVKSTEEVGLLTILPIEQKDGLTLIHYRIK